MRTLTVNDLYAVHLQCIGEPMTYLGVTYGLYQGPFTSLVCMVKNISLKER